MSDQPQPDVHAWRCSGCAINWFYAPAFERCQSCGETCSHIAERPDNVLSNKASIGWANEFARERDEAEELARQQAVLNQTQHERAVAAAAAALNYDADNEWLTCTPEGLAEWVGEAAC